MEKEKNSELIKIYEKFEKLYEQSGHSWKHGCRLNNCLVLSIFYFEETNKRKK